MMYPKPSLRSSERGLKLNGCGAICMTVKSLRSSERGLKYMEYLFRGGYVRRSVRRSVD